jgi:hypothetical protein
MAKPTTSHGTITVTDENGAIVGTFTSVADAFAAADSGATIKFGSGKFDVGTLLITDNDLTITGTHGTVLDGGIQIDASVTELTIENLSIENGATNDDWAGTPIGIYAFGSTHLIVDDVKFTDHDGATDMVGISARTAGPDAGAEFDISNSTFLNLANGVDVENGVSADISNSAFHNAAVVTNNTDPGDHLSVTETQFGGQSGLVFIEGNQWASLDLEQNTGTDTYYLYNGPEDGYTFNTTVEGTDIVLLGGAEIVSDSPYFMATA